ncbi:unnamed protein product [Calypogeia fissa]
MATQTDGNQPVEKDALNSAANGVKEAPSPAVPSNKLRILCIHGFRTSGSILAQQIKLANWGPPIDDIAELVFVDGPWPAGGKSDVEKKFEGPYYEWYQADADHKEVTGVEEATAHFFEYMSLNGPFDGLLGFSQGGVLAAVWISLWEKGLGQKVPNVSFVIEVGGGRGRANVFQPAYEGAAIQCPSLHFLGEKDPFRSFGEALIPLFKDPVIINHPYGHVVPKLGGSEGQVLRDFLLKQQKAKITSS